MRPNILGLQVTAVDRFHCNCIVARDKWDEGCQNLVICTKCPITDISFSLLALTLEYSLQQSSIERDWRCWSGVFGGSSRGEPQLKNTEVSNCLGSHDLS